MNETLKFLKDNQKDLLGFLKTRYHLYHSSNVFFRDIHYGIMAYLEMKEMDPRYSPSEQLAQAFVDSLVGAGILKNVDRNAYVLNYPEFRKPPVKPAAPAKPAAGATAAPRVPAGSAAPKPGSAATSTQPAGPTGEGQTKQGA